MHSHVHLLPESGDLLLLFGASVLASAHCVGMCGPYVAVCGARLAPTGSDPHERFLLRVLFNLGRLASYAIVGLFAGALGQAALQVATRSPLASLPAAITLLASALVALFGLVVAGLLPDPAVGLTRLGVSALVRNGMQAVARTPPFVAATLLGCLQGAFPCALVYGAASRAAMAGSASRGAATMLVFGLGTVPAIFALTVLPVTLTTRWSVRRRWAGLMLIAVAILLALRGLAGLGWLPHTVLW